MLRAPSVSPPPSLYARIFFVDALSVARAPFPHSRQHIIKNKSKQQRLASFSGGVCDGQSRPSAPTSTLDWREVHPVWISVSVDGQTVVYAKTCTPLEREVRSHVPAHRLHSNPRGGGDIFFLFSALKKKKTAILPLFSLVEKFHGRTLYK